MFLALDYGGTVQEGQERVQLSELFKRSLEKEGLYPQEVSSVLQNGGDQNQA